MKLETETAGRYSEIAHHYRSDWRGELTSELVQELDYFLNFVGKPPKKILDAGCGTGKAAVFFTERGYFVSGLDLSFGMLQQASFQARKEQENNFFPVAGNMRILPYADQSFDAVWCMAALVHLDRKGKQEAIKEYARVTSKEGYLYISVQNRLSRKHLQRIWQSTWSDLGYNEQNQFYQHPKNISEIFRDKNIFSRFVEGYALLDERHWFFPTKMELSRIIKSCGFDIISDDSVFAQRTHILAKKQK